MITKLATRKFRKHPGGVWSVIKIFKILLLMGIGFSALNVVVALIAMFTSGLDTGTLSSDFGTAASHNYIPKNAFEWLILPRFERVDLFLDVFTLVITWQLYRILSEINMDNPFYELILKRIKIVYQLIFCGFLLNALRYIYVVKVINDYPDSAYKVNMIDYLSSGGYFSLGAWAIVYLFAHVYKKGVLLQKEQDLTI